MELLSTLEFGYEIPAFLIDVILPRYIACTTIAITYIRN
jgi:hypothetical protein